MSDHDLYMCRSFKLGTLTIKGYTQISHSERRTKVAPRGSIRTRKRFTTAIEEILTVECEQIVPEDLPAGPVALEALHVRPLVGDEYGVEKSLKTKVGASVEIDDVENSIDGAAGNRMRLTLSVNSADGLASGLVWATEAAE